MVRAAAIVLAVVLGAGCSLFDDPPTRACRGPADCFTAQGEVCNTTTRQCELAPDAMAREAEQGLGEPSYDVSIQAVTP